MFYVRIKSTGAINWANAYNTHSEAVNDIRMMERSLGFNLDWEVEYHDKGIYFASMTGEIFMDTFATRECALRWLYETYREATYDYDLEVYEIRTQYENRLVMLDLIGGKN